MQNHVRVTVGIPLYNARSTIADAIRSVLAQTIEDWELIIVDDGSTDGSSTLVQAITDPRVRFVADGAHMGLPARLNQITQIARGGYIARMDADDLMHPDRLRRQLETLDADQPLDVVGTATYTMDSTGGLKRIWGMGPLDTTDAAVLAHGLYIHPTITGRRDWFLRNPYDERFVRAEDHELWCRTVNRSRFGRLSEPLYFYRQGGIGALIKYQESCRNDRAIYRLYGPRTVGSFWTAWYLLASYFKVATYRLATWAGLETILLDCRNRRISEAERSVAEQALSVIRETQVLGLDDQRGQFGR